MRRKLGIAAFQLAFLSGGLIAAEAATETLPPSVIRATTATLNGSANPEGIETAAWFDWGTTTNYSHSTALQPLGNGESVSNFSAVVSGLMPLTTYHFRAVSTNAASTNLGPDLEFTTSAGFAIAAISDLPNVDSSSVSWADYDNDGLLDFLILGTTNGAASGSIAQLWRNTGSTFTNVPIPGLPGIIFGSAAWADFDNDGRMDFLVIGTTNGPGNNAVSQLWRNTTEGFTDVTSTLAPGLPQINQGAIAWGDFNNDGKIDFVLAGLTPTGKVAQIWQNSASGFSNVTETLAPDLNPAGYGWISVADYNNDGWLDFLFTGELINGEKASQLWRNSETGFTDVTSEIAANLPGVVFGSAAWGDYDSDGYLDFIITGESEGSRIAQVWRNTGTEFTNAPIVGLIGARYSSSTWGDFNNDGRLDFLIAGNPLGGGTVSDIWLNTGETFTNANAGLPGTYSFAPGAMAAADFNNDGSLDVLLTGNKSGGGRLTELWQNFNLILNAPAPAPTNLEMTVENGQTVLSWTAPIDDLSGTNLSFNVWVGSAPGLADIINPHANLEDGVRRLPALGNAQINTSLRLNLPPGTYYWSVQAIDDAFIGGAFAQEKSFEILPDAPPVLTISRVTGGVKISWSPATPGWILQENSTLDSEGWSNSPSGETNLVTLPAVENKFFRLFKSEVLSM